MKKKLILSAIMVALIVIFDIVDGKEFSRDDDVHTDKKSAITSDTTIPSAVPVLTVEEATKANEEAREFLKQLPKLHLTKTAPFAVPILTPEEAIKANKEAIRFHRNKTIAKGFQSFIQKIGLNRIHFILSLLPLLFVFDVLLFKRKRKHSSKVFEYFSLSRRIRILFSVSLLAFGTLVFVPWSVYFGNSQQFPFIFQDFVNWNLRVLTFSIIGASIVLLLIPPMISDYLVAAIAGLGLCVYIQAMFMNKYLGTMDGTEPIWSDHRFFGTINLIIWIVIVLTPIVLKKVIPSYFSKTISIITGFVLFLELTAIASMVFSADKNVWSRADTYFVDGSKQFQLSKKKNVVVFIMDALGSGCVNKCFEIYPETKEIVKDFTWYVDARSNYTQTFPGLCNELTGSLLSPPAYDYRDLFEKIWHSKSAKSFYKQVKSAGYDARFYVREPENVIGATDCFYEYFSNIEEREITYLIDYKRIYACLKQMSGFSSLPFFIKRHFFYSFDFSDNVVQKQVASIPANQRNIPSSNSDFLRKMITSGISSDAKKSVLSFHYCIGAHVPWIYDEYCNKVDEPFDNPNQQSRGCFFILSEFIRLLKEANIYNNTAILLCSDHGGHAYRTPCDMTFMIKPFYENKKELSIDDSKVQSIDILPTLLQMTCGDNADFKDFEGYPSFNIPPDRVRKCYRLANHDGFPLFDGWWGGESGYNCFEEYNLVDSKTFKWGTESEGFVRLIPLMVTSSKGI